jgi:hypothetical protein
VTASPDANGLATFDLGAAADAAAAEANARPFAFTYHGQSYEVPPSTAWPISSLRALVAGDLEGALSDLIGAEAFDGMCADGLKLGELNVLFGEIAKQSGMSLPNLPRPKPRGSTRTSRR